MYTGYLCHVEIDSRETYERNEPRGTTEYEGLPEA